MPVPKPRTSRRARTFSAMLVLATTAIHGCSDPVGPYVPDAETIAKLTVTARPAAPTITPTVGYTDLGLANPRDGFLYVPSTYSPGTPAPLLVLAHGAGGSADMWQTSSLQSLAEVHGLVILATESRYDTWDGTQLGRYDVDVAFLQQALIHTFERVNVDPTRVAIGGFSDGASWALGVGIANAGLFRKIIAFTPGGLNAPFSRGNPEIFLSHGLTDNVIPYTNSRDFIVPRLRNNGMTVEFYIFEGGHEIPAQVETAAFNWLFDIDQ